MSLIVVPLAAAGEDEAGLRTSILEMMGLLRLDSETRGDAAGPSPVTLPFVVPWSPGGWEVHNQSQLVRNHVVLGAAGPPGTYQGGGTAERIRYALSEAIRSSALVGHEGEGEGAVPVTLIVPVLVLGDGAGSDRDEGSPEDQLQAVFDCLDEVADLMVSGGLGRTRLATAGFRVMPWIFSSRPMARLPEVFFEGPQKLGMRDITPVLYSTLAASGHQRPWAGYGQTRLVSDLLALQALSGDADLFKKHFPRFQGSENRRCYYLHSGFFEYPLIDLVREHVLSRLSSDADERQGRLLLPTPERLQIQSQELLDEIEQSVGTCNDTVRQVIEKEEISPGAFSFKPRTRPTEERIAQPVDFGRIVPTQTRLSQLSTSRYADRVHDDFYAELRRCTEVGLEKQLREALDAAHKGVAGAAAELEGALQSAFGSAKAAGGGGAPTDRAVKKAVAMIDRVSAGLKKLESELENKKPERPEELLSHARQIRHSWLAREEDLLKEAGALPLVRGINLETAAVGLGVLALLLTIFLPLDFEVWQGWFWAVAIPLLTVGAGYGIRLHRRRQWEEYHDRWHALSQEMLEEADSFGARLARLLDLRIRLIKYSATGDLKRSLRAARERFITELAGFNKLVEEEVAERKLQRTRRERVDERFPPHVVGRFRVKIDDATLTVDVDGKDLHARLGTILGGALTLTEMPRRAVLEEHLAVLRRQADLALDAAANSVRQFAEIAEELLNKALRYGFDDTQLSAPGEHIQETSQARLLLVGQRIEERLEILPILRDRQPDATWVPSRFLPSETAVALTIQIIDIQRESA